MMAVQRHWVVAAVHWSLDMVLNRDKRIFCKDDGARNPVVLKRIALSILRADNIQKKMAGSQKRFRDGNMIYVEWQITSVCYLHTIVVL